MHGTIIPICHCDAGARCVPSMTVAVMDVGIVGVAVDEASVYVGMGVWFAGRIVRSMLVLMVRIMNMPMLVYCRLVHVLVLMPLG